MSGNLDFPVLVGDVGGTNSRFGLVRDVHSELELFDPVKTNDYPDLQSAIDDAVSSKTSIMAKRLVLGIAGPISGTQYKLTNARWNIRPDEVLQDLSLRNVEFMNDFPAQALGVLAIKRDAMFKIGGGEYRKNGTRIVLGPGTSFGIATIVHTGSRWIIIPGEAACADLGLGSGYHPERELAMQPHLTKTCGRLTVEDMITGPGLENLYQAVWLSENKENCSRRPKMSAAQISAAAAANSDDVANKAVEHFSGLLGRVAGNIALTVIATGGVYVTGGMAHKMLDLIKQNGFRREFEHKEPQEELVKSIPTYFVNRELAAVEGLANYVKTPDLFDLSLASASFNYR
ncbi:MAG: glucokinase [Hyphomicrobiales bacterium]|nr:glucokinase [Hyphomicrobiales bacterium]